MRGDRSCLDVEGSEARHRLLPCEVDGDEGVRDLERTPRAAPRAMTRLTRGGVTVCEWSDCSSGGSD